MNNLILDALEQTAARLPEKIAFADEQTEVSFSALVRRAQSVAAALIPLVPPRSVVGFYMDKGVETVVGFMGAVYAGCAYAQLNLRHPEPRVRAMLETLDTPIVVTDRAHLAQLESKGLVALRYVDNFGKVTEAYPANPNGSPNGITAVTTENGRVTIMMPHPERVFRTVSNSWHPENWGEDSPWMRIFRNARKQLG